MHLPHDTALVVLSGGQDSTTCLYRAKQEHTHVHAITFNYGQRHVREMVAAQRVALIAGVESHDWVALGPDILHSTSPLVSNAPLEQYRDHNSLPGGIEKTFVPMRNQLFLTIAANRAVELGARYIYTGVCQEDSGGYPDCRASFIGSLEKAINESLEGAAHPIEIITPLMDMSKADSVHLAMDMRWCWETLAFSHTSYDGEYPPTGKDHATLLRERGFAQAGVPDPLILRAVYERRMKLPNDPLYHSQDAADLYHRLVEFIQKLAANGQRFEG